MLSKGWSDLGQLAWSPDGGEIWFAASRSGSRRSLWAVTLSGRERLVSATPGSVELEDISASGAAIVSQNPTGARSSACLWREGGEELFLARLLGAGRALGRREDAPLRGVGRGRRALRQRLSAPVRRFGSRASGRRPGALPVARRKNRSGAPVHEPAPVGARADRSRRNRGSSGAPASITRSAASGCRTEGASYSPRARRVAECVCTFRTSTADGPWRSRRKARPRPTSSAPASQPDGELVAAFDAGASPRRSFRPGRAPRVPFSESSPATVPALERGRAIPLRRAGFEGVPGRPASAGVRGRPGRSSLHPTPPACGPDNWFVVLSADGMSYFYSFQTQLSELYLVQGCADPVGRATGVQPRLERPPQRPPDRSQRPARAEDLLVGRQRRGERPSGLPGPQAAARRAGPAEERDVRDRVVREDHRAEGPHLPRTGE